jgi:hypothetical protein
MSEKISKEKAEEKLLIKHNGNISLLKYDHMNGSARFLCNICLYEWETKAQSVINRGTGCQKCFEKRKPYIKLLSYEYVKKFIEDNNCKLLSKEYFGIHDKLEIKFSCGHIGNLTFGHFKTGTRCRICFETKVAGKYHKYNEEKFLKIIEKSEMIFIRFLDGCENQESRFEYKCKFGHVNTKIIKRFIKNNTCPTCAMITWGEKYSGRDASNWKGGITEMGIFFRQLLKDWKLESAKKYNYKCAITGERFDQIHHLQPLNLIIKEALSELKLEMKDTMGEYSSDELNLLKNKLNEVHLRYPLGVPLKKSIHVLFHLMYSYESTPENFEEFKSRILSGNIIINQGEINVN